MKRTIGYGYSTTVFYPTQEFITAALEYDKKKNPVTLMKLTKVGIGNSQKVNDIVYKIIIARSKQRTLGHIKYNSDEMKEVLNRGIYDKYHMQ